MATPPTTIQLSDYLNGKPDAVVERWLASDPDAAAVLDALPPSGLCAELFGLPAGTAAEPADVARVLDRLDAAPSAIGKYRVIRELGRGGMGVVYLARDDGLRRDVAIKVIHPKWAADQDLRERFRKEGEALASVKADNVVDIYESGQDGDRPYLVMEYLRGATLEDWLSDRSGPAPASDVLWVAEQVLTGLAHIHRAGLVHRDITPSNLWAERYPGRVKILDLGVFVPAGGGHAERAWAPG